jgi:hypothetical protein
MRAPTSLTWTVVALVAACAGTGRDSVLRESLEAGKPPLASRLEGPVSIFDAATGATAVACGDDAISKVDAWEHELRDDGPVCTLEGGTPSYVLCVAFSSVDQRSIALVFDDATSRLVGVAHAPLARSPALGAWIAMLRGSAPTCPPE